MVAHTRPKGNWVKKQLCLLLAVMALADCPPSGRDTQLKFAHGSGSGGGGGPAQLLAEVAAAAATEAASNLPTANEQKAAGNALIMQRRKATVPCSHRH